MCPVKTCVLYFSELSESLEWCCVLLQTSEHQQLTGVSGAEKQHLVSVPLLYPSLMMCCCFRCGSQRPGSRWISMLYTFCSGLIQKESSFCCDQLSCLYVPHCAVLAVAPGMLCRGTMNHPLLWVLHRAKSLTSLISNFDCVFNFLMLFLRVCCVLYHCHMTASFTHLFLLHLSMDFNVLFSVLLEQCLSPHWLNSLMTSLLSHLQVRSVMSHEYHPSWLNFYGVSSSLIEKPFRRHSIFPKDLFCARRNKKGLDMEVGSCWGCLQRNKENFWAKRGF